MFYQNNNDYMRDAFYYSQPQNGTYQYGNGYNMNQMPNQFGMNGMQNNMMQPRNNMQNTNVEQMYPPIYRIIDPVANRVISNNNIQYVTEDNLNNMVDTVYDIVEGDISTLSSGSNMALSDDTVTQGQITNRDSATNTGASQTTRSTQVSRTTQRETTVMSMNNNVSNGDNQLLRDLIKIIIIKELISRQTMFANQNTSNYNNMYYDPRTYGTM